MKITTDFECGHGAPRQLGPRHWRVDTIHDYFDAKSSCSYNRYFCFRIAAAPEDPAVTIRVEIHPDPALANSHFMTHFPGPVWYAARNWTHWAPLARTWPAAVKFHDDHIELNIPVRPGEEMYVAADAPLRYFDLVAWLDTLERSARMDVESLGKSFEGRDIPLVRIHGRQAQLPRMLVLAGQHPSEHGGPRACEGIVEYLLSSIAEAREITDHFDVAVIPMVNPDGNVRGNSGTNAQRLPVNISVGFEGAAEGKPLAIHENQLLWSWLARAFRPEYSLHFHGFAGWRNAGDLPGDGIYVFQEPEGVFDRPEKARRYKNILNRLLFETPAFSMFFRETGGLTPSMLEHQMARAFGTLGLIYEVNCSSVGPSEQFRRGPAVLGAMARAIVRDEIAG
ncbi:MAG: hypothetical protein HY360_22035 [Verrucomicrobia bacterium]|nr:hypothetical protein [Verrucomicrobiota bacterium]